MSESGQSAMQFEIRTRSFRSGRILLGGFAGLLASCASELPTPTNVPPPLRPVGLEVKEDRTVKVGETLEIFVMEDPEFSGMHIVRERGDIILPKLGRIDVAGLTVEGVQNQIKRLLEVSQLKEATVIVDRVGAKPVTNFTEMPKMLVYVVGGVMRPGQHMLAVKSGVPIYAYEAILIAGGLSDFAIDRGAYVLRRSTGGKRTKIPLDLKALRNGEGTDIELGEGDMVFVPERRFAF
ncbi:MAG: polysaccharide biosynthesis/export family protein [Verrucomicrobiales bacterium]|nr:polysaccharide biosynthesis/export family protein [Verrucomicrobiales bacterium]